MICLCIDLKSFYASVECVYRNLDSMTTKLVVADESRGGGTICLAVSPALKELGVRNRCRLFEIPKDIDYIIAKPRMKAYMEMSALIYSIYLKYVSKDDIHVYSIDECFIDITDYLKLYNLEAMNFAKKIIDDVFDTTGICATAGIGTNLYLAKIAMDITAKHNKSHIAYLDEELFKKTLWHHRPITDFWNISYGTQNRLAKHGIFDMYDITQADEYTLYKEFGVNAELLIDHANGIETCTIKDIHSYKSKNNSLSNSQVLFSDYNYDDALLVLKEMVDLEVMELVDKGLVTPSISLSIGYSSKMPNSYEDYRSIPSTGGTMKLSTITQSRRELMDSFTDLYIKTTHKDIPIRRITISFNNVVDEIYQTYDFFSDTKKLEKEKKVVKTVSEINEKYGKNSILKAMDLDPKATTKMRNKLIGGHNSGEDE
ncbi:MAG: damage repair protein [Acholeplasmatales bacterium]|nr:damage repair protein [Acholeplasmatales bacterium]